MACVGLVASVRLVVPSHAELVDSPRIVTGSRWAGSATPAADVAEVGSSSRLAVSVPATVIIRVDASGRVVSAMTNTGRAPSGGDDMWIVLSDGSLAPAATDQFSDQRWIGDFSTPGVFVDQ